MKIAVIDLIVHFKGASRRCPGWVSWEACGNGVEGNYEEKTV
jgi:hypothetical protein